MKTKLPLLQILFLSVLVCSFTKATDALNKNQKTLRDLSLGNVKGLSIPFEPIPHPKTPDYSQSGFFLRFPGENLTIPVHINMKSNGIWINQNTGFNCSASQTCKNQGSSGHSWSESSYRWIENFSLIGTLVKEQVMFEGGFTLTNADILIVEYGNPRSLRYLEKTTLKGIFGISFRRPSVDAPTFYDFLKEEGIVEKSIFSIYLNASDHGELLFGGYDPKRAGSEFRYAKWEYDEEVPGFSLPIKKIGYGNTVHTAKFYVAVIDFDSESIQVPEWIINEIGRVGHGTGCNLAQTFEDIVIGFEDFTLKIPSTVYTNLTRFEQRIKLDGETSTNTDCTFLKDMHYGNNGYARIVLGRPFLKYFYTVFDLEEKTAAFSTVSGFVPKSSVFDPLWFDTEQVHGLTALIIAGVFVFLIRKIQKSGGNTSRELASQNSRRAQAQYVVVNEDEEDLQQEGPDAS